MILPGLAGGGPSTRGKILSNLKQIDVLKQLWASDHSLTNTVEMSEQDLASYLPQGHRLNEIIKPIIGELYRINPLGVSPEAILTQRLGKYPAGASIRLQGWALFDGYHLSRRWVEEHNPNDATPEAERVFVAYWNTYTGILRIRDGVALRDIIDQTQFKGKKVGVFILRSSMEMRPAFAEVVAPSDNLTFKVRANDMIWLSDAP